MTTEIQFQCQGKAGIGQSYSGKYLVVESHKHGVVQLFHLNFEHPVHMFWSQDVQSLIQSAPLVAQAQFTALYRILFSNIWWYIKQQNAQLWNVDVC